MVSWGSDPLLGNIKGPLSEDTQVTKTMRRSSPGGRSGKKGMEEILGALSPLPAWLSLREP